MKKLFYVLALVAFVACNDSADGDKDGKDTLKAIDSTANAKIDSVENRADSVQNRIDSIRDAQKYSTKK